MPDSRQGPERRHIDTLAYTGPERRKTPGDRAFELAVAAAASDAAQRVSRVHRVRLVTQAAIAAFAVSFLVNSVIGYIYQQQNVITARDFARTNCSLVKGVSGSMIDFVDTDANLRAAESRLSNNPKVLAGEYKVYGKSLVGRLLYTVDFDEAWAVRRWRSVDERRLRDLASTNCRQAIK